MFILLIMARKDKASLRACRWWIAEADDKRSTNFKNQYSKKEGDRQRVHDPETQATLFVDSSATALLLLGSLRKPCVRK
jgi:hypothetical protein